MWNFIESYFAVFVSLYMLFIAFVLFMEGQNPDKTLLWLILIIALPFVGFVAYILLGPDLKNFWRKRELKKRRGEHEDRVLRKLASCDGESVCDSRLATLLLNDSDAEIVSRNRITTLIDGEETFGMMKQKLSAAKSYINMEFFSIFDDQIGNEIAEILIDRARNGVRVRVMYDDVGSWSLTRKYVKRLRGAGVKIHAFMPIIFAMLRRGVNYRNHRKILVIDGEVAFLGGLNIGDMYLGKNPKLGHWRDTHAMFEGDSVRRLNEVFIDDWELCTMHKLTNEEFGYAACENLPQLDVQIASSGPDRGHGSVARGFFQIISNAQQRLWVTTPYLVPGEAVSYALAVAAKSGVDVRIIIPQKADHKLVHWASVFVADQMLRAGIRIYSYDDGFIHAKTIVADDDIVSVGTTNFDIRSFEINYETQAFIYSKEQNEIYAAQFLKDIEKTMELTLEMMANRALPDKIKNAIGRLWSSLL